MSRDCLFGHTWTDAPSSDGRCCTRCGATEASDDQTNEKTIIADGGSDEPPYNEDELAEDEQPLVEGEDALIIGDDEGSSSDEPTAENETESPSSDEAAEPEPNEKSFNPERFNGDVTETPDDEDAAILDAGPENTTDRSSPSPENALVCPLCSHRVDEDDRTIRSGDVCPSCHQGFLE